MKMKKVLALVLIVAIVAALGITLTACNKEPEFKIGLICLHDSNSTYDKNFTDAMDTVVKELKLKKSQVIIKAPVDETNDCYEAAVDLVGQGCDLIFADSFGHEPFLIKAAKEFPTVQFYHATGTMAEAENLPNFHNAFASIYEGRYLAGVAAGMKLNAMIADGKFTADQAKMGYVGAYTYAEVISGYSSFFLGARSVCPTVTMDVSFTGTWYDETAERETANSLISQGAKLISQHADSMGAPTACEENNIPNISYNGSTLDACPNTFIVASKINWAPYYKLIISNFEKDVATPKNWCGGIEEGSVVLTEVNVKAAATGTQVKMDEVKAKLISGELKVFDCSTFTVAGATVTTFTSAFGLGDAECIATKDGVTYFTESTIRSAPYFELRIDGIVLINQAFGD